MKHIKVLGMIVLVLSMLAGCAGNTPARNVYQAITVNVGEYEIERSIITGGRQAGWEMKKMRDGLITGKLHTRTSTLEVRIPYDYNEYSIEHVNSQNLTSGTKRVAGDYNSLVNDLNKAIQKELDKYAPPKRLTNTISD